MVIIVPFSKLRRKLTTNESAIAESRIILTPQLSIALEVCWKPWEETGDVTAAWIEIKFFPNSDDMLWTRLGEFPLYYLARRYADDDGSTDYGYSAGS